MLRPVFCIASAFAMLFLAAGAVRAQTRANPDIPQPTPANGGTSRVNREGVDFGGEDSDLLKNRDLLVRDRDTLQSYLRDRMARHLRQLLKSNAELARLTDPSVTNPFFKDIARAAKRIASAAKGLRSAVAYEVKARNDGEPIDKGEIEKLDSDLQQVSMEIAFLVDDLAGKILPEFLGGNIAAADSQSAALTTLHRLENLARLFEKGLP